MLCYFKLQLSPRSSKVLCGTCLPSMPGPRGAASAQEEKREKCDGRLVLRSTARGALDQACACAEEGDVLIDDSERAGRVSRSLR